MAVAAGGGQRVKGRTPTGAGLAPRAVGRAQCRDASALHYLYARFADDVCADARAIVGDPREAAAVTQDVFAKLATAICEYEPYGELPFEAWLRHLTHEVALCHPAARPMPPRRLV